MIKPEDIFAASNGGLDIILYYYPQAREALDSGNTRKAFKVRPDEKTASAYMKQFDGVWKVTDFGGDGHANDGIGICMAEENKNFKEALYTLADRYGVVNELNHTRNRPDITQRPANEDEKDGDFNYEPNAKFSDNELELAGPKVKENHLRDLSWCSLKWYSRTKKDENGKLVTTVISSKDNYPIWMRDCGEFRKIYQPLNPDKAYRFFYVGQKQKDFVNGLKELKKAYADYNEREQNDWECDPAHDGKPYKQKKLDAAIICSGERDSMNARSYGYWPLWLNSETANLLPEDFRDIANMAEVVYNIPDSDATGKKQGLSLAFRLIDIHTVNLPSWLEKYKDNRGRPRKDLRDFTELRSSQKDFDGLLKMAMPIKFWETTTDKDGNKHSNINTAYFLNFLAASGFGRIIDQDTKDTRLVKVTGYQVEEVNPNEIRAYAVKWLTERQESYDIINLMLNSKRTSASAMEDLPELDIDFSNNTHESQYFFFRNKTIQVKGNEVEELKPQDARRFVWAKNVMPYVYKRLPSAFNIECNGNDTYKIDILNRQSHFFRFLINSSRIFWREEMEQRASKDKEKEADYFKQHQFDISGPRLEPDEAGAQMQNLCSKIYYLGYLMHHYKQSDRPWAVWLMEDKVTDEGTSSGGSGKSFMMKMLSLLSLKNVLILGGKNKKLTDNAHIFENVTEQTDIIQIDDTDRYFDFSFFYDKITGAIDINEKHVKNKVINYEVAPKFVFTSNFAPPLTDPSTMRRLKLIVLSDWYHQQTDENDYRQTRKVSDDFGHELGGDKYSEEDAMQDINFLIDCLQFYLNSSEEINAQTDRVKDRVNIQIMGDQFRSWAEVYFSSESGNLDTLVNKKKAFDDFVMESNCRGWSSAKFGKALKSFAAYSHNIQTLNPEEICNSKGRIISKDTLGKSCEFVYLQTFGTNVKNSAKEEIKTDKGLPF